MIDKEQVLQNIKDELNRQIERKRIFNVVAQVLEEWDGKKLTKRVETDIQARLLEYHVTYHHDKPFNRKLVIQDRIKYVNKKELREDIVIHHDSHGDKFSIMRYLDGSGYRPHIIMRIMELNEALNTPNLLDNLDSTLDHFEQQLNKFKERMDGFRTIQSNLDEKSRSFFQQHNL